MKHLFVVILMLVCVGHPVAHAADVAPRMSCANIKTQIDTLVARDDLTDDEETKNPDKSATPGAPCDTPDEHGCCPGETYTDMGDQGFNCCPSDGGMCFTPMVLKSVENTEVQDDTPVKTDEEIAAEINANIAAGLCADGTKPNKYGCCADELFRDMGGTFACCPKSGGDCFPPMN